MHGLGQGNSMSERVGIFWRVDGQWIAAGSPLTEASPYGDVLSYDGGHAEHWDRWREAGQRWLTQHGLPLAILYSEYNEHPRGRIVKKPGHFVIYADRRLLTKRCAAVITEIFGIGNVRFAISADSHYR